MAHRLKPLSEQVIIVTGASSGIGLATARRAAQSGARVMMVSRNGAALAELAQQLRDVGNQAAHVAADVSDSEQVEEIARATIAAFGGFDTWVNNAGVGIFGRLDEVSDADSRRLFDVNFWGVVNGTRTAAAYLKTRGGAIVNLGSVVSDVAFPVQGMYCASKHAIKGFTDSFRMEMEEVRAPISITLIKPSAINTPFALHAKNYLAQEPKLPPPLYAPEDVADAIVHAATHGGRDYYIGGGGKMMSTINKHVPAAVDWAGSRTISKLSVLDRPARQPRPSALFEAGQDGQVHGDTPHHVMRSAYTKATLMPGASTALLALAGLAGAALLGRAGRS